MKLVLLRLALLCGAALAAVVAWVLAATITHAIPVLALIALAAFCAVGLFVLRLGESKPGPESAGAARARLRWLVGGAVVYMAVAQLAVGRAPQRTLLPVAPMAQAKTWTLSDASNIAYLHVPLVGVRRGSPVIMLHDGPGVPALPALAEAVTRPLDFAADSGFDVYYYDQRGAGLSDRLDLRNAQPYTVARHVSDLEEIRNLIGADRVTLAGHGWGATLAINYLMMHPEHVDKLVLLSPAPLWYPPTPDFVDPSARARITEVQASALAVLERPPLRLLIGRLTATTSPRAAHTLVHDWEADQWWTEATREALRMGQPRLTCRSDPTWGLPPLEGLGFFAYSYTVADALELPDPRPLLRTRTTPALVVRGLCDYVQGRASQDYLDALSGALYVAIPGAGHLIWTEQLPLLGRIVTAFLLDRDVPLSLYAPRRGTTP